MVSYAHEVWFRSKQISPNIIEIEVYPKRVISFKIPVHIDEKLEEARYRLGLRSKSEVIRLAIYKLLRETGLLPE